MLIACNVQHIINDLLTQLLKIARIDPYHLKLGIRGSSLSWQDISSPGDAAKQVSFARQTSAGRAPQSAERLPKR